MHRIRSETLGKTLGSDPMHDCRRDYLQDSFFYPGMIIIIMEIVGTTYKQMGAFDAFI